MNERYRVAAPLVIAAVLVLTGCEAVVGNKRPLYDGVPFKTSAKAVDKKVSRALFSVTVKDAGRSITGARQAAAHAGTRYCIENYGTSRIDWAVNPSDENAPLTLSGGDAIFQGTCNP